MIQLSNTSTRKDGASFAQTTIPQVPMSLEERKAFRRDTVCQSIRQGLKSLEVGSNMYRFKIINVDARHHRFVALIEIAASFKAKIGSKLQKLPQVEAFLKKYTKDHGGLVLEGVFWRVSGLGKDGGRKGEAETDLRDNMPDISGTQYGLLE
jgi:hypothetical protein